MAQADAVGLTLHHINVPLSTPFTSSRGRVTERRSTIVEVSGGNDELGWGECVSIDGIDYPLPGAEVAWNWLVDAARLMEQMTTDPRSCRHGLPNEPQWAIGLARAFSASASGFELSNHDTSPSSAVVPARLLPVPANAAGALADALLDLQLRRSGERLRDWYAPGGSRSSVQSARVLPIASDLDSLLGLAQEAVDAGHCHLVLKIRPGWDLEPIRVVSATFPAVGLAADANRSYFDDDLTLNKIDRLGLAWIEEPCEFVDLVAMSRFRGGLATPLMVDETVLTRDDLARVVEHSAADGINVKPGRVGGGEAAVAMATMARGEGLDTLVGGLLETGVGRAHALSVAACPCITYPTDLGPSNAYLDPDLAREVTLGSDGSLSTPTGGGAGVVVDRARLGELTVESAHFDLEL